MSYTRQTVIGVAWTGGLRGLLRVITVVRTIALAHLLLPSQFGVYGIASLTLALLEILTETGINIFLIQQKEIEEYLDTAWIVSILRGIFIAGSLIFISPLVAWFFQTPEASLVVMVLALVAFVRGFINPAIVYLQKDMKFKNEFWFRGSLYLTEALVTLGFAALTHSVYSLAVGLLASGFLEVGLSFIFLRPCPRPTWNPHQFWLILHSGKWVTLAGIFNYLYHNFDNIVVGRILGTTALGFYDMAYKISSLPITEVADVFARVTFPLYVRLLEQGQDWRRVFTKVTGGISLLVIPFSLLLFIFPEVVVKLLGSHWIAITQLLRLLAVYGAIRAISGSSSALFLAMKKNSYVTAVTLVSILGLGISILPLMSWLGVTGAAWAAIFGAVCALPVIVICLIKVWQV